MCCENQNRHPPYIYRFTQTRPLAWNQKYLHSNIVTSDIHESGSSPLDALLEIFQTPGTLMKDWNAGEEKMCSGSALVILVTVYSTLR